MICPPERCAEILWRDIEKKELAAEAMKVTAADLAELGVIDKVLPEPLGGAHRDPDAAAKTLAEELVFFLEGCREGRWKLARRRARLRSMGRWFEETVPRGTD
jgi:acetyl-CoA carboxylase carboxyl transferase subunit alpha